MEDFPMLGFPEERMTQTASGIPFYACKPVPGISALVWEGMDGDFIVRLFEIDNPHSASGYNGLGTGGEYVESPLLAACMIHHLVETYVKPVEV